MILTQKEAMELCACLKKFCPNPDYPLKYPYSTGNLRQNGIQAPTKTSDGFFIVIGVDNAPVPTSRYALFTHTKNKSSKGWVDRAIRNWTRTTIAHLNIFVEGGLDNDGV